MRSGSLAPALFQSFRWVAHRCEGCRQGWLGVDVTRWQLVLWGILPKLSGLEDLRRTRRRVLGATMAGYFGMLAGSSDPEDGADDTGVRS